MSDQIDPKILALCEKVTAKRPRAVIDRIIEFGFATTEDLQTMGYDHPPRAARDVRENGVPLETFKVRSDRTGRMIAAYKFADPSQIKSGRIGGRTAFSKQFRNKLLEMYGEKDAITGVTLESRYLQIDHRVPYEVAGDQAGVDQNPQDFMLLDASSQRSKSWSCENCQNWIVDRKIDVCKECYWAFPENYTHVATRQMRRVDIVWEEHEIFNFQRLQNQAKQGSEPLSSYIKRRLLKD